MTVSSRKRVRIILFYEWSGGGTTAADNSKKWEGKM
jgi:hypothetical protein